MATRNICVSTGARVRTLLIVVSSRASWWAFAPPKLYAVEESEVSLVLSLAPLLGPLDFH